MQYHFYFTTPQVYGFGFKLMRSLTLNSDRQRVSGFVSKGKVKELIAEIKATGLPFSGFKLVSTKRYWANYDFYAYGETKKIF